MCLNFNNSLSRRKKSKNRQTSHFNIEYAKFPKTDTTALIVCRVLLPKILEEG